MEIANYSWKIHKFSFRPSHSKAVLTEDGKIFATRTSGQKDISESSVSHTSLSHLVGGFRFCHLRREYSYTEGKCGGSSPCLSNRSYPVFLAEVSHRFSTCCGNHTLSHNPKHEYFPAGLMDPQTRWKMVEIYSRISNQTNMTQQNNRSFMFNWPTFRHPAESALFA